MSDPKLYAIRLDATIYMRGTPNDAEAAVREFLSDISLNVDDLISGIVEVKPGHHVEGDEDELVYGPHRGTDITLRECLDAIPGVREAQAAWLAKMNAAREVASKESEGATNNDSAK